MADDDGGECYCMTSPSAAELAQGALDDIARAALAGGNTPAETPDTTGCPYCGGTGIDHDEIEDCPQCGGSGQVDAAGGNTP